MNPSFPVSVEEAQQHLEEMRASPKPFARPVIVTGGYLDPGIIAGDLARRIRRTTSHDSQVIVVAFLTSLTFDACREKLIAVVDREFPSDDPEMTTEVDVIGHSMGGLVARYAASSRSCGEKRLNINRLFTVSSPHRGAAMAPLGLFDRRAIDMRAGSEFITALDEDLTAGRYEIIPYVRLSDWVVGEENAAPPDRHPWWVPNRAFNFGHIMSGADPRIIADIARRLRGEEPLTQEPAQPLPED